MWRGLAEARCGWLGKARMVRLAWNGTGIYKGF